MTVAALSLCARALGEINVVGHGVPGVVDADKEEQQGSRADREQGQRKVNTADPG